MCIVEYLGYACGHSTVHVQRPCPLTTHINTNPVCPNPAERPTRVNTNCPACARILHTRWVEIITLEHQWMHERGTCGCGVIFPALQQPRLVGKVRLDRGSSGKDNLSTHTDSSSSSQHGRHDEKSDKPSGTTKLYGTVSPRKDSATCRKSKGDFDGPLESAQSEKRGKRWSKRYKTKRKDQKDGQADPHVQYPSHSAHDNSKNSKPHALAWNNTISPLIEVSEHGLNAQSPKTTVAVRLSSQYGAEWIPEHAALHAAGRCECPVRFETYQPHILTIDDIAEHAPDWELDAPIRALQKPSLQTSDALSWSTTKDNKKSEQIGCRARLDNFNRNVTEAEGGPMMDDMKSRAMPSDTIASENTIGLPTTAVPMFDDLGNLQYPLATYGYEIGGGSPLFDNTYLVSAYHEPLTMHLPIVTTPGVPVYHQQHRLPLVGWPLGAGPEGGVENSHSPAWNMCQLSRPALKRSKSCPKLEKPNPGGP